MTIDKLKDEGLKLDKTKRKELAYFLLDSIFEESVNDSLTPEQQAELESRLEAFERGEMELIPGEDFANKLKARHGL